MRRALIQASWLLMVCSAGAGLPVDGFAATEPGEFLEGESAGTRVEGGALLVTDSRADFKLIPVTGGRAYRLTLVASFSGAIESIEENPRLGLVAQPGERSTVLPSRVLEFLDRDGAPVGRSRVTGMPFRESRTYVDEFHAPPAAMVLRLRISSGRGVVLRIAKVGLAEIPADPKALNLNPRFALGPGNYSGWRSISAGGMLITHDGKTVLDTKYGSRGEEFPLAGSGTYALSARATGNGYNTSVHLDVLDADGKKLMRATLRRFGETNFFVVPPGAVSASLLVYSCLLEEVRVIRAGDENAIDALRATKSK